MPRLRDVFNRSALKKGVDRDLLLSAESGSGGFLPDYANAVERDVPDPLTAPAGPGEASDGNDFTPLSSGWTLLLVQYQLRPESGQRANVEVGADYGGDLGFVSYDYIESKEYLVGKLHAMVPAGVTYSIYRLIGPSAGFVILNSILEVPSL